MDEWSSFAGQILTTITPAIDARWRAKGMSPVVIAIGDFKNKTSQPLASFETSKEVMYQQIRRALVNSGKMTVNMDLAGSGGEVDSLIGSLDSLRMSGEYDQSTTTKAGSAQAPELVLWGDIISVKYEEGRTTNYGYALNLRLIDTSTRTTVVEEQVQLSKQFTKGLFGS
jgi:PBP1b-binding outer membrane lipoprotein LpoB